MRDRKIKLTQEQESQIENMKKKEKTREKSYNKYIKTENTKKKTQFQKWGDRRNAAKNVHDKSIKEIEDSSYHRYAALPNSLVTGRK